MSQIELDAAILAAFPAGSTVVSAVEQLNTNWSRGFRVDIIEREELIGMAEAEYEGQLAMHLVIPDHTTKPTAWGFFQGDQTKAWYLAPFRNLRAELPPLRSFLAIMQKMHRQSVSPTGKFGFHVTPYYGPPPMIVDWTDSWEIFWTREFRSGLAYVQRMRGENPELVEVAEEFLQKVVPRLLRPLQTGGRDIKPSLCHGDLWDGNIQMEIDTDRPVLFDPCSFFGHHEMDLQCMRGARYTIGLDFVELYKKEGDVSEPKEDFDDRNAMYAVRNDIMVAGMWPQWASLIDKAIEEMRRLLSKHPDGLAGFHGDLRPNEVVLARRID
ncbi:unnamed protein product [Clonostachys rosea]|uniref:protein-ribulosamine 3-kinase n=1 Tax=Bionectria ochroleuca TaxID=29856 RepID=A0ABY6UD70_BIOOC|nr:unnamed protein product [Clonostachys rosea]